ncbi:MAG: hypothetical protein AB7N76_29135 [Planctomycetota bacterium]
MAAEHVEFLERVFPRLPKGSPTRFHFEKWAHGGRVTGEALGAKSVPGVDPAKVAAAAWAVDEYQGNVYAVVECRRVPDERWAGDAAQRFYQRIELPVLGAIHYELLMERVPERDGWSGVAWSVLRTETDRLDKRRGIRSDYNHGCWLAKAGVIAYALGTAPKRDDVGFVKWQAMTKGADATAPKVFQSNIEGMAAWAARRG